MYYELATMALAIGTTARSAESVQRYCTASDAGGEWLGCWYSDIGPLNQMSVLRRFESLEAMMRERIRSQCSPAPFGCSDGLQSIEYDSYQAVPWMPLLQPSSASGLKGPIYELRTYGLRPGSLQATIDLWAQYLPARQAMSPCLLAMHALDGYPRFTSLWVYPSLAERSRIRAEAASQRIWPPKGGPALLTSRMSSTILMPTAASPLA